MLHGDCTVFTYLPCTYSTIHFQTGFNSKRWGFTGARTQGSNEEKNAVCIDDSATYVDDKRTTAVDYLLPALLLLYDAKLLRGRALQILPRKSPHLGVKMRRCDARARQIQRVEEYLDVKFMDLLKKAFYSILAA